LKVSCNGIWLTAPRDVMIDRVAARTGDASDATPAVVEQQLSQGVGAMDWTTIDAGGIRAATEHAALATLRLPTKRATP
jgi:predicted kinase